MRKYSIKKPLLLAVFFSFFFLVNSVQAECLAGEICIPNPINATSFEALASSITDFLFIVALALGSVMIIIAGYYFVTASGDPKKIEIAKRIIISTSIGLGIIMFSAAIISILKAVLNVK